VGSGISKKLERGELKANKGLYKNLKGAPK
ncbi:MAG: hypothetical protein ACI9T7_001513, partial [Oleiphilaceae bacterium]